MFLKYKIYGAYYDGKLVLISTSPEKNVVHFYPDDDRFEVIPGSSIINYHVPFIKSNGLQIGDWFFIYGGSDYKKNTIFPLDTKSEMNTNTHFVQIFRVTRLFKTI